MGIAGLVVLLAAQLGTEASPLRPLADTELRFVATVADQHEVSRMPGVPPEIDEAVSVGTRVRVQLAESKRRVAGEVLEIDGQSLLLRTGSLAGRVRLARASIGAMEVSVDRPNQARRGFVIGAVVVGGLGVIAGGILGGIGQMDCESSCRSVVPIAAAGGVGGATAGGFIGGLIGSAFRSDRWEPVTPTPMRLSIAPGPRGGLSASVSLRF